MNDIMYHLMNDIMYHLMNDIIYHLMKGLMNRLMHDIMYHYIITSSFLILFFFGKRLWQLKEANRMLLL